MSEIRVYDSGYRGACRSERAEQIDCISWVDHNFPERSTLLFHPANEAKGTASHHALRKKEGVRGGVSDIIGLNNLPPFICELKRLDRTKSALSATQKAFAAAAAASGHFVCVAYGFEQFKLAYNDYLQYHVNQQVTKT